MVAVFITGGNNVTGVKGRYREDWETVLPINRQTSVDMRKEAGTSDPAWSAMIGNVKTIFVAGANVRAPVMKQFRETK